MIPSSAVPVIVHTMFVLVSNRYVSFCMKRVNLLRQHGVEPIMVFDGASLPLKGEKHLERRRCVYNFWQGVLA